MDRSFEALQCLVLVAERFSHILRTPLGVALGVLDDLTNGFELGADDLADGRNALRRMLAALEALSGMAGDVVDTEAGIARLVERYSESYHRRFPTAAANPFCISEDCDAMEVVLRDHSPDAINLLFALCAARSRQAELRARFCPSAGLTFRVRPDHNTTQ